MNVGHPPGRSVYQTTPLTPTAGTFVGTCLYALATLVLVALVGWLVWCLIP